MRTLRLVPFILFLLWGGPLVGPVYAQQALFRDFRPLSREELFAKRMRFAGGEPIISIGVMEGQSKVVAHADGPVRLMFEWRGRARKVLGEATERFTFRVERANKATVRYWVVVSEHRYRNVAEAEAKKKAWQAEGLEARTFVTGTIVALRGKVLDTRQRQVAVGGFSRRRKADALVQRLFVERKLRAVVREELVKLPRGIIGIYHGGRRYAANDVVYLGTVEGSQTTVEDVEHSRGYKSHGRQTRRYWGHLYIVIDRTGRLTVVNSVGAERLLAGLVPAEIFSNAPLEALKAQAVTARGEVFSKLGHRHFSDPYHLCTEQHCQVYAGASKERPGPTRAVYETRGLLAIRPRSRRRHPLKLVDSVYSSTCGGFTENNEIVWDTTPSTSLRGRLDGDPNDPKLRPFKDGLNESNIRAWLRMYPPTYDAMSSFTKAKKYRWTKRLTAKKLDKLLRSQKIGRLKGVKILGRGPGGRVTGLRLLGTRGRKDILRELPIRRLFGNLNSGMFVVDIERDAAGRLTAITFIGGGWGHGVGMCQMGAIGRAEAGQTFRQILHHYYNGAVVEPLY